MTVNVAAPMKQLVPNAAKLVSILIYIYIYIYIYMSFTLPKANIATQTRPSQKVSNPPTIHFQVRTVSFREGKSMLRT